MICQKGVYTKDRVCWKRALGGDVGVSWVCAEGHPRLLKHGTRITHVIALPSWRDIDRRASLLLSTIK